MAKPAVLVGGGGAVAAAVAVAAVPAAANDLAAAGQAEVVDIAPSSKEVVAEPVGEGGACSASVVVVPAVAAVPAAANEQVGVGPAEVADIAPAPKEEEAVAKPVDGRAAGSGAGAVAMAMAAVAAVAAVLVASKQAVLGPAEVGSVAVVAGAGKAACGYDLHRGLKGAARAGTPEHLWTPKSVHRRGLPTVRGMVNWLGALTKYALLYALLFLAAFFFFHIMENLNAKPCSRGHALGPADRPLLPGECVEGRFGSRRLGWVPGLPQRPKLEVRFSGEVVLTRSDGSQVLLAGTGGDAEEGRERTGLLCKAERVARGVARMGTPVYGARSRLGQLVLGAERFCSVDASPATLSSRSLAAVWRKGGGILGFTLGGDLEMVTSSGDVIWSDKEGHRVDELQIKSRMGPKVLKILEKRHERERRKRLERIAKDLEMTAKRRKLEEEKHEGRKKRNEKDDRKEKKKTRRRRRLFGRSDGVASEAAADSTSTTAEGSPHGSNVFTRVLGWGQPSPKGAGGQGG